MPAYPAPRPRSRRSLCALALLALAACAGSAVEPPDGTPDIEGTLTRIDTDVRTTVLVEEIPGMDAGGRKISLSLDGETRLLRYNDDADGYGTIEPGDLTEGSRVRAWTTGPVAESYPEQATAHTIVVVD